MKRFTQMGREQNSIDLVGKIYLPSARVRPSLAGHVSPVTSRRSRLAGHVSPVLIPSRLAKNFPSFQVHSPQRPRHAYNTTPGYVDTQPFPAAPAKWTYRAIYRVGDAQVDQWSNPVSLTVGG